MQKVNPHQYSDNICFALVNLVCIFLSKRVQVKGTLQLATMPSSSLMLHALAALVTVVHSQDTGALSFGGLEPVIPIGQFLPVTDSYSNGHYDQAVYLSIDTHPSSNFAKVVNNAVVYSNARANAPSDSLPATAAIFSGASSRNTGIFWETVYDRELYPPGSNCVGPQGTVCDFSEAIDIDNTRLDGGGGFNTSLLPQKKTAWGTCEFVYPHNFIRTNTVFEVGRANGLVTAYADKHLSYEFLDGPSGIGLTQGYFPEIASVDGTIEAQEAWDDLHCKSAP
jgi:hypothetical protein